MHDLGVRIGVDQRIWHFTLQEISLTTLSVAFSVTTFVRSIITTRNSSCWKGHVFTGVCLTTEGRCTPPPQAEGRHPLPRQRTATPLGRPPQAEGRQPLPPADGHCSGRYASYWNAFLFTCWKQSGKIAQVYGMFFVSRCCPVFSYIQRRVDSKHSSQMFAARQVKRDADDGSKMVSQFNCMWLLKNTWNYSA